MPLKITNSFNKKKEIFIPINKNKVNIYCCGVTVYDACHLGHARSYISWDILRRFLTWTGYQVKFIQNFTDIDDKIIAKAASENCSVDDVTEKNIKSFYYDMDALNIIRPDKMPRATKCLEEIILLIEKLIKKRKAYCINGNVYFSVESYSEYGKLSGRDITQQKTNADGRLTKTKKLNQYDFALWKASKEGEVFYESPWGRGRPGWHIECSAMALKELGPTLDIHLGGSDLIFPHHENEIAQSEAANEEKLSKYWMHNGMVNVNGQKMSKSLGNFTTIRNLLDSGVTPMALRFFILQTHYRKPLDFTQEALDSASKGWNKINSVISSGLNLANKFKWPLAKNNSKDKILLPKLEGENKDLYQRFINFLEDDLNTAGALSIIFEVSKEFRYFEKHNTFDTNKRTDIKLEELFKTLELLLHLTYILGLEFEDNKLNKINKDSKELTEIEIEDAIKKRKESKANKDYKTADNIREFLQSKGIYLVDKPNGSTDWHA